MRVLGLAVTVILTVACAILGSVILRDGNLLMGAFAFWASGWSAAFSFTLALLPRFR